MRKKTIVISAALLSSGLLNAQQSAYFQNKAEYRYDLANQLYHTRIYNAAQNEFARQYFYNQSLNQSKQETSRFFDQVIGVILQKQYAEKGLQAFMKEYPNSALFAQANLPLADYYLAQKDFSKALEILRKINQYQLSKEENTNYILKLGYAKFMTGDSKGALYALQDAYKNSSENNKGDVAYMLGHLYYADRQNDKAFSYFDTIKSDPKYAQLVSPYYVQMYYNDKNYDDAIAYGKQLLNDNVEEIYKTEVQKIIGESYFMKGEYEAAYPFLKNYLNKQEQPTESDLYEMGFVAAQLEKYDEAVSYYNRLINSTSKFSQNAYYQLGNAYLQTNKKQEALSAFRSAYQMIYDDEVQKLAHLQYAKLSYDIGNPFEAAPFVIQKYLQNYPNDDAAKELESLLVRSYLFSGNFKETLAAIDQLKSRTTAIDKIDQEVSHLLGTEEFNKGNYEQAARYFVRSLQFSQNKDFSAKSNYWLSQAYYHLQKYDETIKILEKLQFQLIADPSVQLQEAEQINYDLGYAYFKTGQFSQSKDYFIEYLKKPNPAFKDDAELRLADSYYANNQLNEAIALYEKSGSSNEYSSYQKALAYGFKGDQNAKIQQLKQLLGKFPNSEYTDDAQYEIAVAYASQDEYSKSNEFLEKVIKNSPDKNLKANAQIYYAQNLIDLNRDDEALIQLKALGNQYRNTAYASKVVQAARPLFLKKGDSQGYENFAQNIGVNIVASDLDEINLSAARNYFTKKAFQNAIPLYEKYLSQNPQGEQLFQAQFELGESYYQTNNLGKALLILKDIAHVQNDYQEKAITRIAQIYLVQNNPAEAKKYLEILVSSENTDLKNFAHIELMKLYAEEKNFGSAEKYADYVLSNAKNSTAVIQSAKVIKARSLMNQGKDKEAQQAYASLEKSTNSQVAAEAIYAKAYYQNKAKSYKSSNETIFKLANNYASEEFWGAKALLLLAKNYIGLKDLYQASYTCDQIIANYQDFPEIVAEAKEIKKSIKS